MLSKYDINVDVKYKRIETELLENYQSKEVNTNKLAKEEVNRAFLSEAKEDYDEEDIKFICEELYRFELLSAFKAETILDDAIDNGLTELWSLFNNNTINNSSTKEFIELVEKFSEKMGIAFLDSNEEKDATNKLAFSLMFNYDLYYIIHQIIREYVKNGQIDNSLLVTLDLEIDKMNYN